MPGLPDATIEYEPAESRTAMYGGNSNWRGPVWFPVNYLVIRALLQYDQFFGPDFTIEYPTGSGRQLTLREVAGDLADRLVSIWLPGPDGRRPVYGGVERMQTDPAWKDNLLFYEYFHGDNGAGLGAMHQTGWTALVADLLIDPPRHSRRMIFHDGPGRRRDRINGRRRPGTDVTPETGVAGAARRPVGTGGAPVHLRDQHLGVAGLDQLGGGPQRSTWVRSRTGTGTSSPVWGSTRSG